jgi:hypothetical protein
MHAWWLPGVEASDRRQRSQRRAPSGPNASSCLPPSQRQSYPLKKKKKQLPQGWAGKASRNYLAHEEFGPINI